MPTTTDDVTRFSTDPEHYTDAKSCEDAPSFILIQAFESARKTYSSCGGHKLAWRMRHAMMYILEALEDRKITPVYTPENSVDVEKWVVGSE